MISVFLLQWWRIEPVYSVKNLFLKEYNCRIHKLYESYVVYWSSKCHQIVSEPVDNQSIMIETGRSKNNFKKLQVSFTEPVSL